MVDRERIQAAEQAIRRYIRRTPVVNLDGQVTLKLELMQHAGSFKARGAFTNLLMRKIPGKGVVAASGGNHGAAVAYAAMTLASRPGSSFPESLPRQRLTGSGVTAPSSWSAGISMAMPSRPASNGPASPEPCRFMPSTRRRPSWEPAPSGSSWNIKRLISTP